MSWAPSTPSIPPPCIWIYQVYLPLPQVIWSSTWWAPDGDQLTARLLSSPKWDVVTDPTIRLQKRSPNCLRCSGIRCTYEQPLGSNMVFAMSKLRLAQKSSKRAPLGFWSGRRDLSPPSHWQCSTPHLQQCKSGWLRWPLSQLDVLCHIPWYNVWRVWKHEKLGTVQAYSGGATDRGSPCEGSRD